MPYIKRFNEKNGYDIRKGLREGERALNAGELNYQMFYHVKHTSFYSPNELAEDIKKFVDQFLGYKPNYQRYNDMTGALVRCEREIERRLGKYTNILIDILNSYDDEIAKYEDIKIKSNGDVE